MISCPPKMMIKDMLAWALLQSIKATISEMSADVMAWKCVVGCSFLCSLITRLHHQALVWGYETLWLKKINFLLACCSHLSLTFPHAVTRSHSYYCNAKNVYIYLNFTVVMHHEYVFNMWWLKKYCVDFTVLQQWE